MGEGEGEKLNQVGQVLSAPELPSSVLSVSLSLSLYCFASLMSPTNNFPNSVHPFLFAHGKTSNPTTDPGTTAAATDPPDAVCVIGSLVGLFEPTTLSSNGFCFEYERAYFFPEFDAAMEMPGFGWLRLALDGCLDIFDQTGI